ncbi:uncharacterized protein LOC118436025 [Folsomia candida]|uniref:Zinc finger Y-chromosomal protein n=1 Tax=Folsomia candida TaxID=158441 RepID=A0A226E6D1_FOLCA|nr:uncharacterized protein LOC118436025 [Folsomia candida]OXA52507.1 Zinc finger Y-chromosomal protein [Folsomia candida]
MATTATLNGPTGGLHATPTLIHTDNPPPEETCRVDSNSSFESGHEEQIQLQRGKGGGSGGPGEGVDCPNTAPPNTDLGFDDPSIPTNNNSTTAHNNAAYFMDLSEASSKKRRKQSRPVRIPVDPSDETGGVPGGSDPLQQHGGGGEEVEEEEGRQRSEGISKGPRSHVPLNLSGRNDQTSSSSEDEAKSSFTMSNNSPRLNSFSENDKTELLLAGQGTKDSPHRMSTTGSPSLPVSFSPGLFPLGAPSSFSSLFSANLNLFAQQQQQHHQQQQNPGPAGTPTSSSSAGSNSGLMVGNVSASLQNMPPHRIFNPEAYCDLCNKEFCNKYFLKTHKANKHGVYTEMSPSLGMGQVIVANSSSNTSFLTGAAILSSAAANTISTSSANSSTALLLAGHGQQPGGGGGVVMGANLLGAAAGNTTVSSSSGPSSNSLVKGTTAGGISSEIPFSLAPFTLEKGAGNSNGSQQRESFCELCQKEFCNKYFLKRHKAKIHGIPVDSHSSTGSGRSSSSSNHGKSSSRPFSNGGAGGDNKSLSLRELGLESLGLEIVAKHVEEANRVGGGGGGFGDLGGREEGELSAEEETRDDQKSPDNLGENSADENCSYRMSINNASSSNIGDNSCQFCLRDFSSKQHLINHLIKKHRLLVPSTFPPFLFPFPALFDDQSGGGGGGGGVGGADTPLTLNNNGNAAVGVEGDFECTLCNRSFQTVYLLRMHKSYFHPDSSHHYGGGGNDDQEESEADKYARAVFAVNQESHHSSKRRGGGRRGGDITNAEEGDEADEVDQDEQEFHSEHDESNSPSSPTAATAGADDNNMKLDHRASKSKEDKKSKSSIAEIEARGDATSDSDDLRRLQTMIMELNRVSSAVAWSPPLDGSVGSLGTHLSLPPSLGGMGQSGSSGGGTHCGICNKEFYSTYFLQQHIQHFHSANNGGTESYVIKSESPLNTLINSSGERSGTPTDGGGGNIRIKTESFDMSGGGGNKKSESTGGMITISPETLKERLLNPEAFGSGDSSALGSLGGGGTSTFLTPNCPKGSSNNSSVNNNNNNNALNKDGPKRPSPSLSRSYCTICHKELCNKYFMRTHMLKMHGISIESSTGLGGVTCDICNKELCSKYFLKVHKQNTHGIVDEGPSPPNPSTPGPGPLASLQTSAAANFPQLLSNSGGGSGSLTGLNLSTNSANTSPSLSEGGNQPDSNSLLPLFPKEAGDLSNRYFCHYSEVCPFCGRRFRSPKWLKTHLQQDHGEEGRERWKSIERSLRRSQKTSSSVSSSSSNNKQGGGGGGGSYPHTSSSSLSTSKSGGGSSHNSSKLGRDRLDGNKCAFCTFSTGDVETMKSHLIKEHHSQLANRQALSDAAMMNSGLQDPQSGMLLDPLTMLFQKMDAGNTKIYRCAYCPFTTSILVYLYAHERTHTGLGAGSGQHGSGGGGSGNGNERQAAFQCPMCFHTFEQPDAFQQHLIGHQMSGVLAPFFTPTSSANLTNSVNSAGRLGFLRSSGGGDPTDPRALLSLPLLNGSAGDNLYWALKNATPSTTAADGPAHIRGANEEEGEEGREEEDDRSNEPPADLTTEARKKRAHDETTDVELLGSDLRPRKREKILRFRCSYCQSHFASRELALAHVHKVHGGVGRQQRESRRLKKTFRCRKCKFTSVNYQMLVVHNKLQHPAFRPTLRGPHTTSRGTGPCDELPEGHGVAQEDGQFLMQGFLLTSSEEENSNQFVPSVVYLPVREKVSQSIRVSFSLTPTTSPSDPNTQDSASNKQQ